MCSLTSRLQNFIIYLGTKSSFLTNCKYKSINISVKILGNRTLRFLRSQSSLPNIYKCQELSRVATWHQIRSRHKISTLSSKLINLSSSLNLVSKRYFIFYFLFFQTIKFKIVKTTKSQALSIKEEGKTHKSSFLAICMHLNIYWQTLNLIASRRIYKR